MPKVAICVATYRRLQGLNRLLESLSCLRFQKHGEPSITVIIVDNDASGTARSVVEPWKIKLPWPLIYDIESRRGISFARNRLVSLSKDTDFIAFIDDDEVADANWLDELLRVQKRYQADVVTGPVLPRFQFDPPAWAVKGRFFERPRRATGTLLRFSATGNVLIKRGLLSQLEGPFVEHLALQGGEDTLMFRKLHEQLGARIVWANDAIAEELVPKSRATPKWLFQRAYSNGNALAFCERYFSHSNSWIVMRGVKGMGRIAQGTLLLVTAPFIGREATIRAICFICHGAGSINGIFGNAYAEYRTIHGS